MDNYKEYLDPEDGYALVKQSVNMPVHPHWIGVPDGAELYVYWPHDKDCHFQSGQGFYEDGNWNLCSFSVEEIKKGDAGAKILWSREPIQDPALISGADALADIVNVQHNYEDRDDWYTTQYSTLTIPEILKGETSDGRKINFRLKPQTIKLELEIPAPCKAKIGGRDDASFVLNVGRHQYCYNNEDDYTKARDALESVFDAAVRGTNS